MFVYHVLANVKKSFPSYEDEFGTVIFQVSSYFDELTLDDFYFTFKGGYNAHIMIRPRKFTLAVDNDKQTVDFQLENVPSCIPSSLEQKIKWND